MPVGGGYPILHWQEQGGDPANSDWTGTMQDAFSNPEQELVFYQLQYNTPEYSMKLHIFKKDLVTLSDNVISLLM